MIFLDDLAFIVWLHPWVAAPIFLALYILAYLAALAHKESK